ncbi:leucyl aminopeptidase family protein [Sphingobacteriales bacterium UPWRP_1]|nr:hypothetical protein BVG80_15325 [Sphingobacteriales bacterium TSM_CSM]PSJ79118.1 leucyl aminopeptidase family protein [Sphingobacteriales bacterium UPWRP_1]
MSNIHLKSVAQIPQNTSVVYIADSHTAWEHLGFTEEQQHFIRHQVAAEAFPIVINDYHRLRIISYFKREPDLYIAHENCRIAAADSVQLLNKYKIEEVAVSNESSIPNAAWYFTEGMTLANYQFLKYRTKDAGKIKNSLKTILLPEDSATPAETEELQHLLDAVCIARDLINEPPVYQTAQHLAAEFQAMGKKSGFKVTVFDKKKIEALKMGGLLAVNRGSMDPPTFTIMEWKPKNAVNQQPIVLVGKGIVFDTGGLSLKPTLNSMDFMKCDMAGAVAVGCALYAIAKCKLPVYVIGLAPATDNRPGENAYVPGDVITMYNGSTVEVLNTDAEGRMILADALSYAAQYNPELVIDIATLTGAATYAVGSQGMLLMSNAPRRETKTLKQSGLEVYERLVEMPLWREYLDQMKSDIADLKNVGGSEAGAITAAKFLECFTNYPWMHIDMAPVAWNMQGKNYRVKNGSGKGVRLFYQFIKKRAQQTQ